MSVLRFRLNRLDIRREKDEALGRSVPSTDLEQLLLTQKCVVLPVKA